MLLIIIISNIINIHMEKEKIEFVNIPRYQLESILLNTLRKYERIKAIEQPKEDTLLSKKEAAKLLGVCYNTLMRLIKTGSISTTLDGSRVPKSSIDEYVKRKK